MHTKSPHPVSIIGTVIISTVIIGAVIIGAVMLTKERNL